MFEPIALIVSLLIVLVLTPKFIKRMHAQGFLGIDMNKSNKPKVAELGGVIVFLGFSIAIFITSLLFNIFNPDFLSTLFNADLISKYNYYFSYSFIFTGFSTLALIAFIGFIDDIIGWKKGIKQWQHALFPLVAAIPLMVWFSYETMIFIPFFGGIELGLIYPLLLIPLGITGAANAFNMLAGFNGLEAGQGIILTLTLTIIAFFTGQIEVMVLGLAMIGALIGFMKFNKYPAKIFGGDSLTLLVGTNLAVMCILGNMEIYGLILFTLFFVEFFIKAKHKMQSECFGIPKKQKGKPDLLTANPKGGSITHLILKFKPMTENQLVLTILTKQVVISLIVLALFFLW